MSYKWKILAPVDLTRSTQDDVHYAISVAAALRAELHLLYVVDGGSSYSGGHDWPANALNGEYDGIDVHRVVLHGASAETIAEYADSLDADIIVMASRTYGRWKRFWRKSVTEAVMRLSRRPVFIHSKTPAESEFVIRKSRVLCVPGLEGPGETALTHYAESIAARSDSDIVLLHVVPELSEALLHRSADGSTRPLSTERAAVDLASLASRLTLPATTSVMAGRPEKCIASAAWEHSVDLVMVSRASGRSKATYDLHLAGILRGLRCPLLTIPIDAPVAVNAVNKIRAGVRRRKMLTIAASTLDKRLVGVHDFDETRADTTLNSVR